MTRREDQHHHHAPEPENPSPLPPELAEFLRDQRLACLTHGTDRGTVLVIKAPRHEIRSVRGRVPIELRHELYQHPASPTGEIGVVSESSWAGLRQQELGQAQGWHYPADATLVLWECFLEERYRSNPPDQDPLHRAVWQAWENWLIDHSPGVERVVTTWEDLYDRSAWQQFLEHEGYQPVASAAFLKEVARL